MTYFSHLVTCCMKKKGSLVCIPGFCNVLLLGFSFDLAIYVFLLFTSMFYWQVTGKKMNDQHNHRTFCCYEDAKER